jgi:hypothetical protein
MKRLLPIVLFLALSLDATAGCVMCFRTAAAQNRQRARALNFGILVLGVPPLAILGGIVWLAVRRERSSQNASSANTGKWSEG